MDQTYLIYTCTGTYHTSYNPLTQICTSPYCQPYNSYDVSSENLVLDQPIIPKFIFFFILITHLINII